jgi:hypothetical protein
MKHLLDAYRGRDLRSIVEEKRADAPKAQSDFEKYVDLTAKLIGRSYIQTFKLVEGWPLHKIERRYKEAINCPPLTKPAIRWWSLRKQERGERQQGT